MAEIDGVLQHPILDDLNALQDAVHLSGLVDSLENRTLLKGRIVGTYKAYDQTEDNYTVSQLIVSDREMDIQTVFAFAPPKGVSNPMYMSEVDTVIPNLVNVVPVLARVLIRPSFGLPIVDGQGNQTTTSSIFLNFTDESIIVSYDDALGHQPSRGEFDDKTYRGARLILDRFSPLRTLLEFAA